MKKLLLSALSLLSLSSCAVGSAFSAYSLMSVQANSLSSEGKREVILDAKEEIYRECQDRLDMLKAREESLSHMEENQLTVILHVKKDYEIND